MLTISASLWGSLYGFCINNGLTDLAGAMYACPVGQIKQRLAAKILRSLWEGDWKNVTLMGLYYELDDAYCASFGEWDQAA